jgi:hypothetical protein
MKVYVRLITEFVMPTFVGKFTKVSCYGEY